MSNPFVGELRLVAFNFAPIDWLPANGQLMPVHQNSALFSLLGTNFGGNGTSNFALPNLQGSIPIGAGQGPGLSLYKVGQSGGVQNVTLLQTEMPQHNHAVLADGTAASATSPVNNAFARTSSATGNLYTTNTSTKLQMNPGIVKSYGGNLPHNNLMPYLTLNWVISLKGLFPAPN